jgi:hypothetical protein
MGIHVIKFALNSAPIPLKYIPPSKYFTVDVLTWLTHTSHPNTILFRRGVSSKISVHEQNYAGRL